MPAGRINWSRGPDPLAGRMLPMPGLEPTGFELGWQDCCQIRTICSRSRKIKRLEPTMS